MSVSRVSPEIIEQYKIYKDLLPAARTEIISNLMSRSRTTDIALIILGLLGILLVVYSFSQLEKCSGVWFSIALSLQFSVTLIGGVMMVALGSLNLSEERWLKNAQNVKTLVSEWNNYVTEKEQKYTRFIARANALPEFT